VLYETKRDLTVVREPDEEAPDPDLVQLACGMPPTLLEGQESDVDSP
jgi:hypothetical protein